MTLSTTIHDLLDPISGARRSIRIEGGHLAESGEHLAAGPGANLDGSSWWVLPALYDADAHLPLDTIGRRASDVYASLHGGTAFINVAVQWQDIRHRDLAELVAGIRADQLPAIVPVLSVCEERDSTGFIPWLQDNLDIIQSSMPTVCKLYSYAPQFWENLQAVIDAGLLPIIYCKTRAELDELVERSPAAVHHRHAVSAEIIDTMKRLDGSSVQTSPHFLLPLIDPERLFVLPEPDDDVRLSLASRFLDDVDLVVTDHNAPPLGTPTGPGLQVAQDFLSSLLTASRIYDWPIDRVWAKATTNPSERFGIDLGPSFVVVDPEASRDVGLWQPRQTVDRAPYLHSTLAGRVIAIGANDVATLV